MAREDKFTWEKGDIRVVLYPQCIGCKNNNGLDCSAFNMKKPRKYVKNIEECPNRKEE